MKKQISIIAQCYNEEEMLPIYYQAITATMNALSDYDFELIIVDDCSKDNSALIIKSIVQKDRRVKSIIMSRNFGKAQCCMAGLYHASGDYIVTMDIDMQDPPSLLSKMITELVDNDIDVVATKTVSRKGYSLFHKLLVRVFYSIFNHICSIELIDGQRDYRLMKRSVVEAILEHKEYNLFDKGYFCDVGFRTKWIEYESEERAAGQTKWRLGKLIRYSLKGIIGYSLFPLWVITGLGALFAIGVFLLIIAALLSLIICGAVSKVLLTVLLIFALLGGQFIASGILALYIGQIHIEVKNRPRWIVREYVNCMPNTTLKKTLH